MAITNARNGYINGTTSGWTARSLFAVGNDWYAVVLNTSAVLIEVHKSTDGGVTWTEMDSGDSLGHSGATHSYDANMPLSGSSTDFIYVAYRTATNTVRVRRFDTSTDTWESTDIGSADASTTAHSDFGLGLAIRSDDDVILVYRNSSDNDLYHRIYEGSSWAAQVAIHTTNTSIPLSITMTGNSDMAHVLFFESTANDITQCSIDNANTLGTSADIDATALAGPIYSSFMGYVNDGGTHRITALINDSTGEFDFVYSTSSSAPTWTTTGGLTPTTTSDPGKMGGAIAPFQERWHSVWSGDARGAIHADVLDDYATPGAATTDRDVVTGLANDPAVYAAASINGVGVLYTDFTTPSVDFAWAWGAQPTAITARTPTLDTTSVAATTHTVTIPTGLADDDVVYIWLACNGGSITTGPSGFTEIANENTQANPKYSVWRKVITNAAGETTWGFNTSSITKTSICVAFIGVDTTTPEDVAENTGTGATGSSASLVAGVTTATDDALLVWSVALNSSTADIYEPPIMAKFGETTGTKRQMVTYEPRPTAGATGDRTGGSSSASLPWAAIMFAIRPAASGGGTYDTPANNIALGTPAPTYSSAFNYTTTSNDIALGTPAPTYSFAANYTTTANNIALGTPAPDWSRNSDPFETPANNIALGTPAPEYNVGVTYETPANNIALGTPAPTYTFAATLVAAAFTGRAVVVDRITGTIALADRIVGQATHADRITGTATHADRVTGRFAQADRITGTADIA